MKNSKWVQLNRIIVFVAVASSLGSCSFLNTDKPPLPGKRESVFQEDSLPKKNSSAKNPRAINYKTNKNWLVIGGAFNHVPGALTLSSDFNKVASETFYAKRSRSINFMQPLIQGDTVYLLSYENEVFALDSKTLRKKWSFKPELETDSPLVGGIAVDKDKVLLVTPEGKIFVLKSDTGNVVWKKDLEEPMCGAPTVSNESIILQSKSNKIYALSLVSGEVMWMFSAPAEGLSFLKNINPAVYEGKILAVLSSGDIVMLRGDNGAVLWHDKLDTQADKDELSLLINTQALPLLDKIYTFILNQKQLVAFDQRNSRQLWEESIKGHLTPAVTEAHLFVIDDRGYVFAMEKDSGKISWVSKLPVSTQDRFGPYITSFGVLVFNDDEALFLDIKDGTLKKKISLEGAPVIAPVIVNNTLYILDNKQNLTVYK